MHRAGGRLVDRLRAAATRRRVAVLGTLAVFAGLVVAFRDVDVASVVAAMARADSRLLAAAVCLYVLSWPLRGRRYGDILAATGHPLGTRFLTLAVFLSQTANLVLPARAGDGVRAYVLQARRDVPYPAGFASLAVERVFDLAAIAVLGGLATLWLAAGGDAGPLTLLAEAERGRTALLAAGGVTAATLTVGVSTVVVARSRLRPGAVAAAVVERVPRLDPLVSAVVSFAGDIAVVARNPRAMVVVGVESLVVWVLDVATAILVLAALDGTLASSQLLIVGTLAVSVGNLAKVLPLSQGGIGLYEAAFTALVVALTPLGASTALAAAVVDHALKNAVTLVGGAGAITVLGVSPGEAARQGSSAK